MKSALALTFASLALSSPVGRRDECTSPVQRKSWTSLSDDEKLTYLNAEVCLQSTPAQYGIEGAETVWDELQYAHLRQSNFIHGVGAFLPWHRYYMTLHEKLLQTHCGYTGGVPYWEEATNADNITESVIWDATYGIGGDGSGDNNCVADGPFSNLTLRFYQDFTAGEEYCLNRSISTTMFQNAGQEFIDNCYNSTTFDDATDCYGSSVHSAGHGGTGGTMQDPVLSPGDPVFFLHHTNLDRLYWEWQSANSSRLTEVSGRNTPTDEFNTMNNWDAPGPEFTDYSGDDGDVTTLSHVLWMVGMISNATIADVLDIGSATICADNLWEFMIGPDHGKSRNRNLAKLPSYKRMARDAKNSPYVLVFQCDRPDMDAFGRAAQAETPENVSRRFLEDVKKFADRQPAI